MGRQRIRLLWFVAALFLPLVASPSWGAQKPKYTIAVLPQRPPVAMNTAWGPFLERLARETGMDFKLKLYDKMSLFEDDFAKGRPDFIFATPTQTVEARHLQHYRPLVRSTRLVSGIIVARKDSPINSIEDLEGKEIAFIGAENLCSIFVRHMLYSGVKRIKFTPIYSGSTDNVFKTVLLGKASAGATLDVDEEREPKETQSQLKTIYKTRQIAPHAISAHPRVPAKARKVLSKAVLAMGADPAGRQLLKEIRMPAPVQTADYARDYQHFEAVDIRTLKAAKGK